MNASFALERNKKKSLHREAWVMAGLEQTKDILSPLTRSVHYRWLQLWQRWQGQQ